ncbi:MAG: porin family protein [Cyclobacteriaceae bacterium]
MNLRNRIFYILLILPIMLVSSQALLAQQVCTQTLKDARVIYEEGRFHELPILLKDCINSGFTTDEKVEAYKLLTISYIYLDQLEDADQAMLNLLRTDPEFVMNELVEPTEFIILYKTFRTWPILRLGGRIGANYSLINIQANNAANDGNNSDLQGKYLQKLGFQASVVLEILLNDRMSINPELHFTNRNFDYSSDLFQNEDGTLVSSQSFLERQSWIELPILFTYNFNVSKRWYPYISAGLSGGMLVRNDIQSTREITGTQAVREQTLNFKNAGRNSWNLSVVGSVGLKYKFGRGYLVFDARYSHGLTSISDAQNILNANPEYFFDYYGPYHDFKINNAIFSTGYLLNIYKPKKLRK